MAIGTEASGGSARQRPGTQARFRKLKPRPGRAGEKVAGHQRARLHAATIALVGEQGYEALTVTGIARAAGVSNRTFYENFEDKEECFCATYELIVRHTAREILAARRLERSSQARLRAGLRAFAREVGEKPDAARLALVEAFASPSAMKQMRHTNGLFEALVSETFADDPAHGVELPPLVAKAIVGGVTRIARTRLLAGTEERLSEDVDELIDWTLSLCNGNAAVVCSGSVRVASEPPPSPTAKGNRATVFDQLPGDERAMILSVTARLAAEEGYAALSVPRIRAAAGVSRRRFEEYFDDVADCFLATLEALVGRVLAKARAAYLDANSWPRGIHRALATICREFADDPVLVRLTFFELYASAGATTRWRADSITNLCAWLHVAALRSSSAPARCRPKPRSERYGLCCAITRPPAAQRSCRRSRRRSPTSSWRQRSARRRPPTRSRRNA
ncbi:MAG: TetR/AcrR family transcriptional regulator [Solirubrobacterales bacterium]